MDQLESEHTDDDESSNSATDIMDDHLTNTPPPPGHVLVLGRWENEHKLKSDVERIMHESSLRSKKDVDNRQALLLRAREHHFTLDQLKQLLPDEAFSGLIQQMPTTTTLSTGNAASPRLDTPSSFNKTKGKPSGMRRLFSSKKEDSFDSESPSHDNGSPRPSFSSIPRTPTMPRKMSDTTTVSPESFVYRSSTGTVSADIPKASELDLPVFVYGINMFPSILLDSAKIPLSPLSLLETHMCPVELSGYFRVCVKQADWPALIPVTDPSSRLKAELTFNTNQLFPGRRWCNYVAATPADRTSTSAARTLQPIGTVGESFKKKAVRDPKTGVVTKLDDLSGRVPVHPDDVFDLEEPYTPPSVDGMLVFGLSDTQRAHLDHYCGFTSSKGKPLARPLYSKERVIVDFNVRVEKAPSTPNLAGPEYIPSNPSSNSKPAPKPVSRKPIATHPSSPQETSMPKSKSSPTQPYDPATITFDPSIDPHPYDPKLHPFKPIDAMTDDEYDAFTALDRRWRAACIKWNLRPKLAAIRADEQNAERAEKMRKMDLIMGIMDAHQRDVEDAAMAAGLAEGGGLPLSTADTATSTPHTSFGSETAAALAASSFGSTLVNRQSLDGEVDYELVPLRMEAFAYVWAGNWHELESPLEKTWSEEIYY